MHVLVVGSSYKCAPRNVRDNFYFQGDILDSNLSMLLSYEDIKEVAIFSNSDMTDIYAVAVNYEGAVDKIKALLSEYHDRSAGCIDQFIYEYKDLAAIRHLFNVALGLESLKVNDTDILIRLTDGFTYCMTRNTTGDTIIKMIKKAVELAESQEVSRVRTYYLGSVSGISFASLAISKRLFNNFTDLKLLLIGGGELAEEATRNLINSGVKDLVVINSSFEIACKKAEELFGRVGQFNNIIDELASADIVICSTGAQSYLISKNEMSTVMDQRLGKPILLIDMSVPRNIDPGINDIYNVYLYDIDNMSEFVDDSIDAYKQGIDHIKSLIEKEAELFWIDTIVN